MNSKFCIEDIYKLFGQYDWMATFYFKLGSRSYNKFGSYVTGRVEYNFEERKELEKVINNENYNRTEGKVRLRYFKNDKDDEYISKLRFEGFHTSDIKKIDYLPWERENKFINDNPNKEVPNIVKIPTSDIPNFDKLQIENIKLKTFESRFHRGASLLYEEKCEYVGILAAITGNKLPKDIEKFSGLSIDEVQNNPLVYRHYLKTKNKREGLDSEENIRLIDLEMNHIIKNLKVFQDELNDAFGSSFDLKDDEELFEFVKKEVAQFEKERLLQIKPMVYWDIKGFCHTYLRHVEETQVGGNSVDKSTIPYNYQEIKKLIQQLLKSISTEIEEHYSKEKKSRFKRVGPRAVYYHGDYYYVVLEEDGRLDSFYPKDRHYTD